MSEHLESEPWYFLFVDIIYVGAVKNIGRVLTECSCYSFFVYMTAASFLVIMFSTRLGFDVFSHSYETRYAFNLSFIFAHNIGVILMAFFIEMRSDSNGLEDLSQCQNDELFNLGGCHQSAANSTGFATGFLISRVVLILAYLGVFMKSCNGSQSNSASQSSSVSQSNSAGQSCSVGQSNSAGQSNSNSSAVNEVDEVLRKYRSELPNSQLLAAFSKSRVVSNLHSLPERMMYTRGAAAGYQLGIRHQMSGRQHLKILEKDRFEIFYCITVYAISSIIVAAGLADFKFPQPYWLLAAAAVESFGGLFKDMLSRQWEMWACGGGAIGERQKKMNEKKQALEELYKRTAGFYQSRLFSFYIVVLGEAVLGLVIIPVVSSEKGIFTGVLNLVMSYFIIFSLGYRYSVFTTPNAKHAMAWVVEYGVRDWYIWLHVFATYAILMVSNAIEHVFEDLQLDSCDPTEAHDNDVFANTLKLGVGLVTVWLCLIALRMFHYETGPEGEIILFGCHFGQSKLLVSFLAVAAHAVGSVPGLIRQDFILIYHGCIVFLPILLVAIVKFVMEHLCKIESETEGTIEMTAFEGAVFINPIRSSMISERASLALDRLAVFRKPVRSPVTSERVSQAVQDNPVPADGSTNSDRPSVSSERVSQCAQSNWDGFTNSNRPSVLSERAGSQAAQDDQFLENEQYRFSRNELAATMLALWVEMDEELKSNFTLKEGNAKIAEAAGEPTELNSQFK